MVNKICETCGKSFRANNTQAGRFCCKECYWESMRGDYPRREVVCPKCKKTRVVTGFRKTNFCMRCWAKITGERSKKLKGEKSPVWKGGEYKNKNGYIYVTIGAIKDLQIRRWAQESSVNKALTIPKHRLLMIKYLKRPLRKGEVVHHLNGNKTDNRLINLMAEQDKEHRKSYFDLLKERDLLIYKIRKLTGKFQ